MKWLIVTTALVIATVAPWSKAHAAEIKVLSFPPLRTAMSQLVPQFERASGHKVSIDYVTPGAMAERIKNPGAADVVMLTTEAMADLQRQARIVAGAQAEIAKVGMGVFVRKGAGKPDVTTQDAFKRALLAAKSVAYIDPATGAPGGIYLNALFERLGIAGEVKGKTKNYGPSGAEAAVAAGEVELGLSQLTVILASPAVELVGPLPPDIQNYLHFTAGLLGTSGEPSAAKSLIDFLSSPDVRTAMRAKGYE
jgi:molybdate transport system substrate-binding protein